MVLDDLAQGEPEQALRINGAAFPLEKQQSVSLLDFTPPSLAGVGLLGGSPLRNIYAGLVAGVTAAFGCLALAGLVMPQPPLAQFMPAMLGMMLTTAVLGGAVFSLRTRIPFGLAGPEAMASCLAAFMVERMAAQASDLPVMNVFATMAAAVCASAVFCGIVSYAAGRFSKANWVRFIPTQITGGVLAGVGFFLVRGAFCLSMGEAPSAAQVFQALSLEGVLRFWNQDGLFAWTPALVYGVTLFAAVRLGKRPLVLPFVLALGLGLGWAARLWPEWGLSRYVALDGFLGFGSIGSGLDLLRENVAGAVLWPLVWDAAPFIVAMAGLVVMTDVSRAAAMEVELGCTLEMDREFRALGLAGIVSGLAGGAPSALALGRSLANEKLGARGPLAGLAASAACLAAYFFGGEFLHLVPRFMPAGLLFYFGLSLMKDWLADTRSHFTRRDDYLLLLLTFGLTVSLGLLFGMAVGVVLALVVTMARTGGVSIIAHVLTGDRHRSNVERAPEQMDVLRRKGESILVLHLRGFLLHGSMHDVIRCVEGRIAALGMAPLTHLVLDFRSVVGMGSAVSHGFTMLSGLSVRHGFQIVLASLPLEVTEHMDKAGYGQGEGPGRFLPFMNTDIAMEWCENRILKADERGPAESSELEQLLAQAMPSRALIPALLRHLRKVEAAGGQLVFRQGDASDAMYFVESGSVDIQLELDNGRVLRLKKMGPGTVFGEMGLYTASPRTATVQASANCVLYRLSAASFRRIQRTEQALASAIHFFVVRRLSESLAAANIRLRDLQNGT